MGWAKRLGTKALGIIYNSDSVPWCGVFVGYCLAANSLPTAPIAVRASAWSDYGANLREDRLALGAILVFQRPGGGHVAFYYGEDSRYYYVLGGNQSDSVNVMRIEKSRCVARRWPRGVPVIGGPVWIKNGVVPVSRNEA